ncbi:BRO family, N-terminal domain [Cohaesibacter sp. ES.047]|nr:BRO family, N-terminal domain [Cohaesibacter sp. ES.047]
MDVCGVLGYGNASQALIRHVEPLQKNTITIRSGIRGNPNKTVISEGGLYALRLDIDGEPWFVAKDVCDVLGYTHTGTALRSHVDPSQQNTVSIRHGIRGNPNKAVISEGGLYALVLGSKLPQAIRFKLWVTDVVLLVVARCPVRRPAIEGMRERPSV